MSEIRFAIITCSDTRTLAEDTAGHALRDEIERRGWIVDHHVIVSDTPHLIKGALVYACDEAHVDIVLTCGGTGFGPRDVTPEVTQSVAERMAPGIAEAIRSESMKVTRRAMLSRATAGLRGTSLIVNLPGSKKGATESLESIADQFEHAIDMIAGKGH